MLPEQPLGFVEPDYDGIDGLAWAWCGSSDHVEQVIGAVAPHFATFAGWRNPGSNSADCLIFAPNGQVPRTSAEDWTLEYIGRLQSKSVSSLAAPFVSVGGDPATVVNLEIGNNANTGGFGMTAGSGFQTWGSGLVPGAALHHFIVTRYRGRMFASLLRYDTEVVTRSVDSTPPTNPVLPDAPFTVTLLKPRSTTETYVGEIFKAAVYTRGMPESEAEGLLRNPWSTFKRRRSRTVVLLSATGGTSGNAPGATVTASTSFIPGAATGAASAAGALWTATSTLLAGTATGGAAAAGATITASSQLLDGAATGSAAAGGVTLTATTDFIPGAAAAGVLAPGATITATASLFTGAATGAAQADGQVLPVGVVWLPGAATGESATPGNAPGTTWTTTATLIPGVAFGDGVLAPGVVLTATATLIPGSAVEIADPMLGGKRTADRRQDSPRRTLH